MAIMVPETEATEYNEATERSEAMKSECNEATSKEVKVVLLTTLIWAITALTFVFVSISGFVLGLGAYQSGVINTMLAVIVSTPVWAPMGFFLTKGYNLAYAAREEAKKPSPRFELARKKLADL